MYDPQIIQDGAWNDPVFDLLIKIFISIRILESNIQKGRPLHEDLSSVNQVFSMTTIMSGNFFNTSCDVDYSMAHIPSYLNAGLND
jgi:hypothetical protein